MNTDKRRSGIRIMGRLIGLVKPLLPVMLLAVVLGTIGYLCAIFLTILAGYGLMHILLEPAVEAMGLGLAALGADPFLRMEPKTLFIALVVMAVMRGLLHYGEQYCNHFIAFKLLAIIRHKVFAALRKLCPAKLEGRDKGNLISVITSDIELLEVFYAHTISPIAIAVLTSLVMILFIGHFSPLAALLALAGYAAVGAVIPLFYGSRGAGQGMKFRNGFGELNSFILDSLRGLDETIQYRQGEKRRKEMEERSERLGGVQKGLNHLEASQRSVTNLTILLFSFAMLFLMIGLMQAGQVSLTGMLVGTIAMMGSFGPVTALASLSNNLNQTLASGERVLSILEEEPQVEEVAGAETVSFTDAEADSVNFAYEEEQILKDYSIRIPKGKVVGIHGASGSGKSTLLKLLMRFWDVESGQILISGRDVRGINTFDLRSMESYVTQETCLFHDSIANNIAVGKPDASREEIMEAAKKASIHDFIMTLPKGYDTEVGELGDTLSGGEKQRIGIARAFLHDAPFVLLDEPTSNLDSLNEGIILKSLKEGKGDKTVLLVSHRKSTMNLADIVYEMDNGRLS
ncbi:MAG TPA: ABC transporter ATP-binding protein/permease [Candidatus Mediterraneibacter faecigallinarum]|uniref:ABC transporter ATP-binding protein/permease n=1 Tax=Candidatus Mediterraneibacter faecigallinarum TaxID=2838669 RepID=A0A9D2NXI2_9FIRM|nr:ABC transporter ATP-binding protein/permease [Candidatus Mediterraneibacter faecigallinarum]